MNDLKYDEFFQEIKDRTILLEWEYENFCNKYGKELVDNVLAIWKQTKPLNE